MMEALVCHPLGKWLHTLAAQQQLLTFEVDTIKVRMQLSRRARAPGVSRLCARASPHCTANHTQQAKKRGFIATGSEIVKRESPLGLYKGLGAVLTGIIPKMAIRFTSYEWYKQQLASKDGTISGPATFFGT